LLFKEGIQVRHLDGNYLNNHFENISIGTQSDNNYDIPKIVRIEKAMKGAAKVRKFDKETVEAIRVEKIKGASLSFLSKKYSAAKSTMSYIINRKTYSS
jgi:site-specific recombinase XerC